MTILQKLAAFDGAVGVATICETPGVNSEVLNTVREDLCRLYGVSVEDAQNDFQLAFQDGRLQHLDIEAPTENDLSRFDHGRDGDHAIVARY